MKSENNGVIKFTWRHNLIYPVQLLIWNILRKINTFVLDKQFGFSKSLLFTLMMFLGEFFFGIIVYLYQKRFLKNKKTDKKVKSRFKFVKTKKKMKGQDSIITIVFLIFLSSYFDFVEFILSTNYIPYYFKSSGSLEMRLGGILTISSALFFYYLLKLDIFRHQFFSLLVIGICLIIVIITEFCFQDFNIFLTYEDFGIKMLLIFFVHFFNSLLDSIEKYIIEFDFIDIFLILSLEGLFGFLITFFYSFSDSSYITQLKNIYSTNSGKQFVFFIILLVIYLILCGGRNAFRIVTNKIYSPMTKTLTDYFINPIYLIINYIEGDFVSNGKQNLFYFLINFILSIIISLCGCIYNEIIVLFFCGLEKNTHHQITKRSFYNYSVELTDKIFPLDETLEYDWEESNPKLKKIDTME